MAEAGCARCERDMNEAGYARRERDVGNESDRKDQESTRKYQEQDSLDRTAATC